METMSRLLEALPLLRELPERLVRWRLLHWLLASAVCVVLAAFVMLAAALYLFMAQTLAPWQALAITGLVAGACAIGFMVRVSKHRRQRETRDAHSELNQMVTGLVDDVVNGTSQHRSEMVLLGLAAGVLLGVFSDRRKPR